MATLSIQGVHDSLTEALETSLREGPQTVTKDGIEVAVVVPISEWRRLTRANGTPQQSQPAKYATFTDWLLAPEPKIDNLEELIGPRGRFKGRRPPVEFD
jgi:antitoxin Phd